MKTTFSKDEIIAKLKESLSACLGLALEGMTGNPQLCHLVPDLIAFPDGEGAKDYLAWTADYSGGEKVQLRIFASPENWRLIGKTVLVAADLDTFDDPALESTFCETIAQAASSWSNDLSGLAGSKWEVSTTGTNGEAESNATTWAYRLPMGEGEAQVIIQVSEGLMSELLVPPPIPEPALQSASAASESSANPTQFDLLLDVELPVSVSFGRALVPLKEVLKLSSGSIVELNRAVTEPVEVIVNNCVIARGEVVVVEGNYGVRIQQIVSRQDRLRTVN